MLVGNDVVDLRDPENQPEAIHSRFDARVFTWNERARILAADSPHRMRWALWAAKESAYKVARKLDSRVYFSPRAFTVRIPGGETEGPHPYLAEVSHPLGQFQVCLEATNEWVHAVASVSGTGVAKANWQLRSMGREAARRLPGVEASARVRKLARSAIASALSAVPSDIVIAAAAKRVPRVTWRGQRLPVDLSLSHHGRFVACAWGRITR
ncbi:MAG: 4'-phosphopantetheinyl transferase superfamily protein [Gemmatimonadota bacterium]